MIQQEFFSTMECNWTIEKSPEPEKYYKIISVVFFLKESSYKKPEIYINGLKNIINNFKKIFFDFRLRIYHDNTTHQLIKKNYT